MGDDIQAVYTHPSDETAQKILDALDHLYREALEAYAE